MDDREMLVVKVVLFYVALGLLVLALIGAVIRSAVRAGMKDRDRDAGEGG